MQTVGSARLFATQVVVAPLAQTTAGAISLTSRQREGWMNNRVIACLTRLRLLVFCASLLFVICASLVGSSVSVKAGFMSQGTQQTQTTPNAQTVAAEKT